jgi:hypothetical protein
VLNGRDFPSGQLIAGAPAKAIKPLS